MVLLSLLPTVLQPSWQRWLDLFMVIVICNWAEVGSTADMYTYKPNHPCFYWKGPCFGGLTFKNRGRLGSKYISWTTRAHCCDHQEFKLQAPSQLLPRITVSLTSSVHRYVLKVIKEWGSGSPPPPHLLRIMITHGLHKPPYSSETQWKTTETCGEIQYPRENGAGNHCYRAIPAGWLGSGNSIGYDIFWYHC